MRVRASVEAAMSRSRAAKRAVRLATKNQLWVLNRAGWVELRKKPDDTREVTNSQADAAIKESMRLDEEQAE
jgi:hypothetical protein